MEILKEFCDNPKCETRRLKQFVHFVSKKAMDIAGLSAVPVQKGGVKMGLRDMIRAIREYPALSADLETARAELDASRTELRQTKQAREQSINEARELWFRTKEQDEIIDFYSNKSKALQAALVEFCPQLSTPEDMKRFYDTISPNLDAQGLTLYHTARELTKIDVPSFSLTRTTWDCLKKWTETRSCAG